MRNECETALVTIRVYKDRVEYYENGKKLDNVQTIYFTYDKNFGDTKTNLTVTREPLNGKYRPEEGEINISMKDVTEDDLKEFRKNFKK